MYQEHGLSGWYFLSACGVRYFFLLQSRPNSDSKFYNSSGVNCCKPSEIQNTHFLGWWTRWQSIKGNEPAAHPFYHKRKSQCISQSGREKDHLSEKGLKIHCAGNFLWNMYNFYFIYFKWIYISPIRKEINKFFFKRLITDPNMLDNKFMGHLLRNSDSMVSLLKEETNQGDFFVSTQIILSFSKKESTWSFWKQPKHRQFWSPGWDAKYITLNSCILLKFCFSQ